MVRSLGLTLCLCVVPFALWAAECAPPPPPVLGLSFESRYAEDDPNRATLDESRQAAAKAALADLDGFLRVLAEELEAILAGPEAERSAAADCLLRRLQVWARADALGSLDTETAELTIGSRLAAIGIVARAAARISPESPALTDVRSWLARRMEAQMEFWETAPPRAGRNNLRAWAALAGAVTADLIEDPVMRGWAAWSVSYVLCSAAPDGSLPNEMERGAYALHYQLHALAPLVSAVRYLREQGIDLTGRCNGSLDRAVWFALSDLSDGARTEAITGRPQSLFTNEDPLESWQLAWLEAYFQISNDLGVVERIEGMRPLSYSKLGGNQTLLLRFGL